MPPGASGAADASLARARTAPTIDPNAKAGGCLDSSAVGCAHSGLDTSHAAARGIKRLHSESDVVGSIIFFSLRRPARIEPGNCRCTMAILTSGWLPKSL